VAPVDQFSAAYEDHQDHMLASHQLAYKTWVAITTYSVIEGPETAIASRYMHTHTIIAG
jgi:hypothetical protein